MSLLKSRSRLRTYRAKLSQLEPLESRALLAVVAVNAGQVVRQVDTQLLGVNLAWWDSNLNTTQTAQMVQAAGLNLFRFPGGSSSDDFHFNAPPSYQGQGTDTSMASFVASVHGQAVITLDYGSGSPQEAAAMLAYFNGSVSNTTVIGTGQEWSDSANAWQTVDWKTAGYWASLRAATPLAQDDGLNFLRVGHAAPFAFHDYEVGNEEYGSWEIDHHSVQHDPATYVAFAKSFATLAAQIDPTISIGVDSSGPGTDYNNWIGNVLQLSAAQGLTPGFISDHNYVQAPGSESDSNLLLDTVSAPGSVYSWASRASGYENLLTQDFGAAGKNVELLATEYNSVYSDPGKQSTSLVNGLFVADSLGSLLETQFNGANVWDLRNGYGGGNASTSLYGWRQGGDYGLLGSPGTAPSTGTYVPYPTYFAEQLGSKIIQAGGTVVTSSSSDPNLAVYAVHEANGDLELLVINKSAAGALTGQFQLSNFVPSSTAQLWQYGEAQDTAQSQTTDGHSALANSTVTLSLNGSAFSYAFPAYSMTVLDLTKASGPTVVTTAAATPNPVIGKTTAVSVSATDPAGAASLTYTWSTTGTPPAGVTFAANGTNAAQSTIATFVKAGTYSLLVTVADPSGLTTTSSVTVLVNQTLTSITVSPGSATVTAGATQQFAAQSFDQFGNTLATPPTFSWSVISGAGTINTAGLYTAPTTSGTAKVQASSGGILGTASVTISPVSTTTAVSLSSSFNRIGIVTDGTTFTGGGLDHDGSALSANLLGTSVTAGGVTFNLGPAGANDVVSAAGQTILLPSGNYATLKLLATGVNGNQANETFVVTYTDGTSTTFTQSISDWFTPQGYVGESKAVATAYRDLASGGKDARTFDVYDYAFNLNAAKTVKSITLPNDANTEVLAATLARSATTQVGLAGSYNRQGIVADGSTFTHGFDSFQNAMSANLLGSSVTSGGVSFALGAVGSNDTISGMGQTISLPGGQYQTLSFLGAGAFGNQTNQTFTVNYADGTSQTFTQSLSDWWSFQSNPGETVAASMAYINESDGTKMNVNVHVYQYSFALNPAKTVSSITLPNDSNVQILAIDLLA